MAHILNLPLMLFPYTIQSYSFNDQAVLLAIPDREQVAQCWQQNNLPESRFPFWAKLWPAARGLCQFLADNTGFIRDNVVLELAAGLGLPSVFAAKYARNVVCSDYITEIRPYVEESANRNMLQNLSIDIIDWNHITGEHAAEIILMSDINYNPAIFPELESLFTRLLNNGKTIILSTPQRLMAKPFINSISSFCIHSAVNSVDNEDISVFVYKT